MISNFHFRSRPVLRLHPLFALVLSLYQKNQISLQFPLQLFKGSFSSSLLVGRIDVLHVICWRVSVDILEAIDDPPHLLLCLKGWSVVYVHLLQICYLLVELF